MKSKSNFILRSYSKFIYDENADYSEDKLIKANDIVIDIAKLLISLSTGIVTISITLQKEILHGTNKYFLLSGWIVEGLSILLGVVFLYSMLKLYRNWNTAKLVDPLSTMLGIFQFLTFIFGIILLGFSAIL